MDWVKFQAIATAVISTLVLGVGLAIGIARNIKKGNVIKRAIALARFTAPAPAEPEPKAIGPPVPSATPPPLRTSTTDYREMLLETYTELRDEKELRQRDREDADARHRRDQETIASLQSQLQTWGRLNQADQVELLRLTRENTELRARVDELEHTDDVEKTTTDKVQQVRPRKR